MSRKVFALLAFAISLFSVSLLVPVLVQASANIDDITAPVIVSASIEPAIINTSYGPVTLTLTIHVIDDLSGIQRGYYRFQPANPAVNGQFVDAYTDKLNAECQGSLTDLVCKIPFTLPQYAAGGEWVPTWIFTVDVVGNRKDLEITPEVQGYASFLNSTDSTFDHNIFIPTVQR